MDGNSGGKEDLRRGAGGEWTSGLGKRVVAGGMPKSYSASGEVL